MASGDAFERALGALARKERTTAELEAWLTTQGFDPDEIAAAVERLTAEGALDDERFARRYAEDKRDLRGWGPRRIREALEERGVAAELVSTALHDERHDEQLDRAVALLTRRAEPLDDDASRARALGYLVRRGHDSEIAYAAVRRCAGGN